MGRYMFHSVLSAHHEKSRQRRKSSDEGVCLQKALHHQKDEMRGCLRGIAPSIFTLCGASTVHLIPFPIGSY